LKEFFARLIEQVSGFIIGLFEGDFIQCLEGNAVFEERLGIGQGFELFIRGHQVFVAVTLGDPAFVVADLLGEETGAVEVKVRGKDVPGEIVDL